MSTHTQKVRSKLEKGLFMHSLEIGLSFFIFSCYLKVYIFVLTCSIIYIFVCLPTRCKFHELGFNMRTLYKQISYILWDKWYMKGILCVLLEHEEASSPVQSKERTSQNRWHLPCVRKLQGYIYTGPLMGQMECIFNILLDVARLLHCVLKNECEFIWQRKM